MGSSSPRWNFRYGQGPSETVSFRREGLDRLMIKIKAARRNLTEEPGSVVLKEEVEMSSSIKPGRIKISRPLMTTTIVLVLLLSLDRLLYLAERRNQEESISEAEPVAGQGEFPTNGPIFRYKVMTRNFYRIIYWTEVWRDDKLEPEISEAFYYNYMKPVQIKADCYQLLGMAGSGARSGALSPVHYGECVHHGERRS
jgi:hypothetical protein